MKPELEQFLGALRILESLAMRSAGQWRVPQDAVDIVMERLENRLMQERFPRDPERWVRRVFTNLLRSGPEKAVLQSGRHEELFAEVEAEESEGRLRLSEWREAFRFLEPELRPSLTPAENRVLTAVLKSTNMHWIAEHCGCSRRDVRARLRRIGRKGHRLLTRGPRRGARSVDRSA